MSIELLDYLKRGRDIRIKLSLAVEKQASGVPRLNASTGFFFYERMRLVDYPIVNEAHRKEGEWSNCS